MKNLAMVFLAATMMMGCLSTTNTAPDVEPVMCQGTFLNKKVIFTARDGDRYKPVGIPIKSYVHKSNIKDLKCE